jgi:hypothetical protein
VYSLWIPALSSTKKTNVLCSMDSNDNLVGLAHCLYEKENQEGHKRLLGLCQH